ncbi:MULTISPECIES: STAS domain-containing protein [unclassified Methylophaga]|jgi:phospholipid transport system transporter-binding protein|uniref:STAS domain-containing protein n=1 Tax=unclassified Methylophaga TaxID=2629249 RepID=UPI000C8E37DE|nr:MULTISPECIES: STAS domain-containing protein [unclassified Methylophaga]MAK67973.1 anti-anti-sigma factor [Methylophaga sp.]MAY16748.1 anti-anti-sigma factor [Methylophaga sp.]MBN46824.1 anti-anti-sigma factor [Methylophaga sp.]HAO24884.1 anti-anti-sigma factor [Methylophaga sp.]HCD04257.1 anti-anti-sigma factor [Methylophaga sp.]|tara:strand:+ start:13895 stop:14191 length:297 start_codon:yes stop_codon:yes gene_type:complete
MMNLIFDDVAKRILVSGELTFGTAASGIDMTEALFAETANLDVDLSKVTHSDSAGLALLIEWMRQARKLNKPIRYFNMPAQMLAMAEASGLEELLPLQ